MCDQRPPGSKMRKTPAPDAPWIVSPIRQLCGVESWMRTGGAGFGPSRSAPASFVCRSELDLALTLDILNRELGVKRLLLERGGGANGAFLRAGLVDELNSSVRPWTARRVRRASSIRRRRTLTRAPVTAMTLESSVILEGGAMVPRYLIRNAGPSGGTRGGRSRSTHRLRQRHKDLAALRDPLVDRQARGTHRSHISAFGCEDPGLLDAASC
jgi:hypothetical protein